MSELLALRRAAAKRQAKKRAAARAASGAGAGAGDDEPQAEGSGAAPGVMRKSVSMTTKGKGKGSAKGKGKKMATGPTRRLNANELKWKAVNTSTVSAMEGGGGMLMLEELEGVGVEWVEEGDGRRARFVTRQPVDEVEAEAEAGGEGEDAEDGEDAADDDAESDADAVDADDLPTFAGLDADDFTEEGEAEPEPSFEDGLLPAWAGVPIHSALKHAMVRLGFVNPTDIQARAVPQALEGHDVVGVAETGSGKTLAYSLPILSHLLRQPAPRAGVRRPLSALVLCPTRELALQVTEHLGKVLRAAFPDEEGSKKPPRVSVAAVVGGLSAHKQTRVLARGADILVATPGRLWDILKADETFAAGVRGLRYLVIDEADRMIEQGHFAELEHIVQLTQRSDRVEEDDATFAAASTALTRAQARDDMQTFVFSATLSKDLQANLKKRSRVRRKGRSTMEDLVDRLDFRDAAPVVVDLSPEGGLVASLREAQVSCVVADKDLYLYYFLLRYPGRTLVFTSSIDGIRRLIPLFETLKVPVYPLHSQLQQKQRLRNLDRFKNNAHAVLIATDVAARGLDIPSVDHVVHFNLPRSADAYVHRSGRTARAQNPGFALQLVSPEDRNVQRGLMKALKRDELPAEMEVEAGFLRQLRERIALARDIEKAQHAVKKEAHDRNWLKEAAEAMDVDIDPSLLSDEDADPDAPTSEKKNRRADKAAGLKAQLARLLQTPLVARGVSTRYPTSGTRVIVDDVLSGAGHNVMLGAGTKRAFEEADEGVHKARKVVERKPRVTQGKSAQERKQEKRDERKRKRDGPRRRADADEDEDDE